LTKNTPTARRAAAVNRQRSFGDRLRTWLHDRAVEAEKRRREKRKDDEELDVRSLTIGGRRIALDDDATWVHRHYPEQHPDHGRFVKGLPYVNPNRDARSAKAGRLRKELQS